MARKPNAAPPQSQLPADETINGAAAEDELQIAGEEDDGAAAVELGDGGAPTEEDSVESLKAQLTAAEQRAEREAAARAEAERRLNGAAVQQQDSNLQIITTAINGTEAEKKNILDRLKVAKETGDIDAELKATDELQQANINLKRLNEGKSALEDRIEQAKEAQERSTDPVEQYIAGAQLAGPAAGWVRRHADLIVSNNSLDRAKIDELNIAHHKAVGNRLVPNTDAYFEFIENELTGEPVVQPAPKPNGSARPPAAPPSRRPDPVLTPQSQASLPSGISLTADGKYRMSAERREAARMSGLTDAEYLKHALAAHREGAIH